MIRYPRALLLGAAIFATSATAYAEPPPAFNAPVQAPPAKPVWDKDKDKDKNWKEKEKEKELKEKQKDKDWKDKDKGPDFKDKDKGDWKPGAPAYEHAKQKAKAKAEREELMKKLAAKKTSPETREELRTHARRQAELQRIADLAKTKGDTATELRANKLLVRENARHETKMKKLGAWK